MARLALEISYIAAKVLRTGCRIKGTFHLTISMHGQLPVSKIQRNNCHNEYSLPSFTGKTSSVSLISHTQAQKIAEREVVFTAFFSKKTKMIP